MTRLDIWVATQAKPPFRLAEFYKPIFVGADLSSPDVYESFQYTDNSGESISKDNSKYCELTALYWAWKNAPPLGIAGLCHYRRFFLFKTKRHFNIDRLPFNDRDSLLIDSLNDIPPVLIEFVQGGGWITAPRKKLNTTVYRNYVDDPCCSKNDFDIMITTVTEKYPEYSDSVSSFIASRYLNYFNMFLARGDAFCLYCSWLFDILSSVNARLDYSGRNKQQMRVLGFLGERLLSLYIHHNNLCTKEVLVGYHAPKHRLNYVYRGSSILFKQLSYRSLISLQSLANLGGIKL